MSLALRRPRAFGKLLIVAAVAAMAFAAGSALVTQGAPAGTTSYACVDRLNGTMRYVKDSTHCTRYEFLVSWASYSGTELDDAYVNEGQPDSITTGMIVDGQVMNADLAADSVTSDKILDSTILAGDLAPDSVGSDEIQDGAVGTGELAGNSVNTDKILDDTIALADMGDSSVGSNEIVDGSVATVDLADGSVTTPKIADGAVTTDKLADGGVTSMKIADETITAADLAPDSVGSDEIQTSAVGSGEVLDNSLTAGDLADDSVGSAEIAAGAVTTGEIADGTIIQDDLSTGLQTWIDGQTLEGYDINSASFTVAAGGSREESVACDAGLRVVGGGVNSDTWGVHMVDNHPFGTGAWYGSIQNSNSVDVTMTIYAICVAG